jgi:hypothetical protein
VLERKMLGLDNCLGRPEHALWIAKRALQQGEFRHDGFLLDNLSDRSGSADTFLSSNSDMVVGRFTLQLIKMSII